MSENFDNQDPTLPVITITVIEVFSFEDLLEILEAEKIASEKELAWLDSEYWIPEELLEGEITKSAYFAIGLYELDWLIEHNYDDLFYLFR